MSDFEETREMLTSFDDELYTALRGFVASRPPGSIVSQRGFQRRHAIGFVKAGALFELAITEGKLVRTGRGDIAKPLAALTEEDNE